MTRLGILTAVLALAVGCATTKYSPTAYYAVQPVIEVPEAQPIGESLGIRPLEASRPYLYGIVMREPDLEVVYLPHASWAEKPAEVLTRAITDALAGTQRFSDVGSAANMFTPGFILTGQLRRFEGIKNPGAWSALCEVRLELRKGIDRLPVWTDTLSAEVALDDNSAAGLAKALSEAAGKVAADAAAAIVEHTS